MGGHSRSVYERNLFRIEYISCPVREKRLHIMDSLVSVLRRHIPNSRLGQGLQQRLKILHQAAIGPTSFPEQNPFLTKARQNLLNILATHICYTTILPNAN